MLFNFVIDAHYQDIQAGNEAESIAQPHRYSFPKIPHGEDNARNEPKQNTRRKDDLHRKGYAACVARSEDANSLRNLADGHTDARNRRSDCKWIHE